MLSDDLAVERLRLLMAAKAAYQDREFNRLDSSLQVAAIRKLNQFGVLSVAAIAALVGVTEYRVKAALGEDRPEARGRLNPAHLDFLVYLLTGSRKSFRMWVKTMIDNGTSISTIEDLTLIPRSTIYRKLNGDYA